MIGIYKITSPSGKIYIGQSIDIERRKLYYQRGYATSQTILKKSIDKYGWINHIFEVIQICEETDLNSNERYWQEFYECVGKKGLNCLLTKSNNRSGILSIETKKRMSLSQIGRKHTEETKSKMREYHKLNPKSREVIYNAIKISAEKKLINIVGCVYNRLTAIKRDADKKDYWVFKCECGKIKSISSQSVKRDYTKSCGCLNREFNKPKDVYGYLKTTGNSYIITKKEKTRNRNISMQEVLCECSTLKFINLTNLVKGYTKHCGCKKNN